MPFILKSRREQTFGKHSGQQVLGPHKSINKCVSLFLNGYSACRKRVES